MYNHNKAQQSKNRVHIPWDILHATLIGNGLRLIQAGVWLACVVLPSAANEMTWWLPVSPTQAALWLQPHLHQKRLWSKNVCTLLSDCWELHIRQLQICYIHNFDRQWSSSNTSRRIPCLCDITQRRHWRDGLRCRKHMLWQQLYLQKRL